MGQYHNVKKGRRWWRLLKDTKCFANSEYNPLKHIKSSPTNGEGD